MQYLHSINLYTLVLHVFVMGVEQPSMESLNAVCRVYCRFRCVFEHDYAEVIDKVLDGKTTFGSAMELEKAGINACIKECMGGCLAMHSDPSRTWLELYNMAVKVFGVMTASADLGNIAAVLQYINNLDEMSVAEYKGLLDYLCRANQESGE